MNPLTELRCSCGQVHLDVAGTPIITAECCCTSCRTAGARMQALAGAPQVLTTYGATPFVLYRKDRIRKVEGAPLLKEFRLTPEAKTRRVVASCCNTPVFFEFSGGHWLSLYACLWPEGTRTPLELRTCVADLPAGTTVPDDVPNAKRQNATFILKLLGAWIAMGLSAPKITYVNGALDV